MHLLVQASGPEGTKAVAWLSFQPDGAISVGLRDRTFISPTFRARSFVWNVYNRVTTEYLVPHTPEALRQVLNPHLTFHPPIYFHLRQDGKEELFAGIADVNIMLQMDGQVPWVRFTSAPYDALKPSGLSRPGIPTDLLTLEVSNPKLSIGVCVNFSSQPVTTRDCATLVQHAGFNIEVYAEERCPQAASLSWYHQS